MIYHLQGGRREGTVLVADVEVGPGDVRASIAVERGKQVKLDPFPQQDRLGTGGYPAHVWIGCIIMYIVQTL